MKRFTMAGATALAGVVLLTACSHGSTKRSSGGGQVFDRAQSGVGAAGSQTASSAPGAARPAAGGGAKQPAKADGAATLPLAPESVIRTADIVVQVAHGSDVAARANRAAQIAIAAGGQVYADERTSGTLPTAALTLKVPGPSLLSTLGQLSALGKEKSRHSSTQDVTGEVADVNSRVKSAQSSINQWRLLLGRATKIGDIIALESELSQREADLESLQSQQRAFAAQTAMATVTLNLTTAAAGVHPKDRPATGFLGGLRRGWHAFASAAGGVATGIGAALPFLVLALLLAATGVLVRRRVRTARPVVPPGEPA